MIDQYVLATNDDGDLAIRTVSATESSSVTDTTSVITATDDGKLAVRVVGGGGSDPHNLGYYADLTALQTAYPTGTDGDFAILGSTDTIWVWDSGTSAWKDTDTKGQVTSVNNQTGAVTLDINDVAPTQTGKSGYVLGTDGFVAGWVKPEIVQVSALPAASEDEVDNIYQFVGTTDATYTNGYFYKCVSDGQNPATYSWTQTDVQPQAGGLPSQTGQSGKFLTTDGTDASWAAPSIPNFTANGIAIKIGSNMPSANRTRTILCGDYASYLGTSGNNSVAVGFGSSVKGKSVAIGDQASCGEAGVAVGMQTSITQIGAVAIGWNSSATGQYAIALGSERSATGGSSIAIGGSATAQSAIQIGTGTNSTQDTFQVWSYPVLNKTDGTIPEARLADTTNAQQGDVLTLDSNGNAVWQAGGGGGGSTALSLTLAAANWSNNSITVTATGVTTSNNVIVSPAPASQSAYTTAGVMCTGQSTNSLTFTATTTPSSDIVVTVLIV